MKYYISILLVLILIQCSSKKYHIKQEEIVNNFEYFEFHLSHYNPKLNNEFKDTLQTQLNNFIFAFENSDIFDKDKFYYYSRLGDLYRYAYNVDLDNSWQKCVDSYMEAIKIKSDSFEPRYFLAVHLLSSGPNNKSFEMAEMLLLPLANSNLGKDHPEVYYTTVQMYVMVGDIKNATKFAYKYLEECPTDPESIQLLELAYAPYNGCVEIDTIDDAYIYSNYCTGYNLRYKSTGKINKDLPFSEVKDQSLISFTQFYTPYAIDKNGDSIYNDISVMVYNYNFSHDKWIQSRQEKNVIFSDTTRKINHKDIILSKSFENDLRDVDFFSDMSEKFKGIATILKGEKYFYVLQYTATESTYYQNLEYFEDVEKNFKLISSKAPEPGERPRIVDLNSFYQNNR